MAKQIRRDEITEADIFKNVRESAMQTKKEVEGLTTEVRELAAVLSKEIAGNKLANSGDIQRFVKDVKEAQKVQKQSIELKKIDKKATDQKIKSENELKRIETEKLKTERNLLKERRLLNAEEERAAKAAAKTAKATADENNAYKQLVKTTRDQKNESKRLAVELIKLEQGGRKNSKEFRKLSREYREVTKAAQKGDKALKKIDRTVGDNFRNVGNYNGALRGLRNGLAQLGLAFGAFSAARGAVQTVADFQNQVADLSAITGLEATGDQMKTLKQNALDFSVEFGTSAAEIVEAFKLAGSARPELLQNADALSELTRNAVILSKASGDDVKTSIESLAGTLNAFNRPASDASKVMDILANAAQQGTKEIPFLTQAFTKFGGIAAANNVGINESAAAMEFLGKKIPEATTAGTNFRNILLKLSAPGTLPKEAIESLNRLGIETETLSDKSAPLNERLAELTPLLEDNEALVRVFGSENALAAQTLIENAEAIGEFSEEIEKPGTAFDQMNTKSKTLTEAFGRLREQWNKWVIELTEGVGASGALTNFLDFIAKNLPTIISLLVKVAGIYAVHRARLLALNIEQKLFGSNLRKMASGVADLIKRLVTGNLKLKDFTSGIKKGGNAMKNAKEGVKKFGSALSGILWTAAISGAIALANAFIDIASGASQARENLRLFQRAANQGSKQAQKRIKQLQDERDEKLKNAKTDEERLQANKDFEEQVKNEIRTLNKRKEVEKSRAAEIEKRIRDLNEQVGGNLSELIRIAAQSADMSGLFENATDFEDVIANVQAPIRKTNAELTEMNAALEDGTNATADFQEQMKFTADSVNSGAGAVEKITTAFSNQLDLWPEINAHYREFLEIQDSIAQIKLDQEIIDAGVALDKEIEKQKKRAQETGFFDFSETMRLNRVELQLRIAAIRERAKVEVDAVKDANEQRFFEMRRALEIERKELIEGAKGNADALLEIEANYQTELAKIKSLELDAETVTQEQIKRINLEADNEIKNLKRENAEELADVNKDLDERATQFALKKQKEEADAAAKAREAELEAERQAARDRMAIIDAVAEFLKKKSDERIAQLDKEIKAAEKNQNRLEKLADEGNIKAEQSLAEQEKIKAEAERRKLEEERRQQRIELARVALNTYNSKVEQDSKQPLAETIRDISLLQQFISTIPAFLEGTEDTGSNGRGVDGLGGFHAILHPNERVVTKEQNALIGGLSNNELAKVANDYNTGKLIKSGDAAVMLGNGWNSSAIIEELTNVQKAIENQPSNDLHIENVVKNAFDLVKTTKKGNTVIYNRYRLNS